jgi:hypothetical protein
MSPTDFDQLLEDRPGTTTLDNLSPAGQRQVLKMVQDYLATHPIPESGNPDFTELARQTGLTDQSLIEVLNQVASRRQPVHA